jgi:hypothetical protein
LAALLEFDGRYWPLSIMSLDGDAQAVKFVQADILDRSGFSVGENDGFADKRRLGVPKRAENRRCAELHGRHGCPRGQESGSARSCCPRKMCMSWPGRGNRMSERVLGNPHQALSTDFFKRCTAPWICGETGSSPYCGRYQGLAGLPCHLSCGRGGFLHHC